MKKIVAFLILLVLFALILTLPAVETPAAPTHPLPLWSILCYLAAVAAVAVLVYWEIRGKRVRVRLKPAGKVYRPGA